MAAASKRIETSFWDRRLETLGREQLRSLQEEKLQELMAALEPYLNA